MILKDNKDFNNIPFELVDMRVLEMKIEMSPIVNLIIHTLTEAWYQ